MTMLLLRKYWGVALAVVLLGWVMLACHQRDRAIEQRGRAIERAMQLDRQVASLRTKHTADSLRADSLERIARVDTVQLARWLTRYDTVRARFDVHDTVEVIRFAATADSTIHSCRQSVMDLLSSCQAKDTVIADLRSMVTTLRAVQPIPSKPARRLSLGVTAGYGATLHQGQIITGPSATVGAHWRIF